MKIIATTKDGFLCELSRADVNILLEGVTEGTAHATLKIGTEIPLIKGYEILYSVRNLDESRIKYAKDRAQTILSELDRIEENISALTLFDKLAEDHDA